ncbi:MAG TPA: exodeoxyribonuclease V subunit beta, partial [Lactobacillus sp.]|nr:exodeoxyribonuclease V subunit beta [Lactobacillus sp.]
EFGYLCKKNCGHTLHLADKCQYERNFSQLLGQISRRKLPLVHPPKTYRPTKEQFDFLKWLAQNKHVVINLLGVGGSGKTYTLGQILDPKKTLALAPTHKARLNLAQHGF